MTAALRRRAYQLSAVLLWDRPMVEQQRVELVDAAADLLAARADAEADQLLRQHLPDRLFRQSLLRTIAGVTPSDWTVRRADPGPGQYVHVDHDALTLTVPPEMGYGLALAHVTLRCEDLDRRQTARILGRRAEWATATPEVSPR